MSRRALRLAPLIALLLLLQWGTAFAHCLRGLADEGPAVEICTADGVRTLHLDDQGQGQKAPAAHDSCPLCPSAAVLDTAAPSLPGAPIAYARVTPWLAAGLPPLPARAPPQQPRAPPAA